MRAGLLPLSLILRVGLRPSAGHPKWRSHISAGLISGGQVKTVDVYLCPKSFFDDIGHGLQQKGDELSLTGSKVKQDGADDLILVREVVKGSDTFVLRDEKGNPVWSWATPFRFLLTVLNFGHAQMPLLQTGCDTGQDSPGIRRHL